MLKLLKNLSEQKQEIKKEKSKYITERRIHVKSKIRVRKKRSEEEKERKGARDETTAWKDD